MGNMLAAMRIVTYDTRSGGRAGIQRDDAVIDIWSALDPDERAPTVKRLLESGRIDELAELDGPAVDSPRLLPPVPDPQKILCIGLNYRAHAEEAGIPVPDVPTIFGKYANALAADGATVNLGIVSEKVDFEAEIAFVIGKTASHVPVYDALDHVAGYTLLNDLSARDLQFASAQWMGGKIFEHSAPCGPALVTPDEAGEPDSLKIELRLNGEQMQTGCSDDMIFSIAELVTYLSTVTVLRPGDIVSTGTPSGIGAVRSPRIYLRAGDEVVIDSPTLGRLTTRFE